MSEPPTPEPAPTHTPSLHDVDERWTVPWALVEETSAPGGGEALAWHGREEDFSHVGYAIARPMLYSSDGAPVEQEASCIDTALPVGEPDFDGAPALPHWATYANLTPVQRANYLKWLASGRRGPLRDINYAFLYFYGLERHALIDRGEPEDILRALMGLLKHYDGNASFFSCASRLAAFLFATKGIEKLKPAWFDRLFVKRAVPLHNDSISVALTWLYARKKPLPAPLAFEIARQDLRCPHVEAFRANREAFEACFTAAYTEEFGAGMRLQRAEKNHTWKYRPVNPALQSWEHFSKLWSVTSTDVAAEQAQFEPLVAIWRACAGEAADSPWTALVDAHLSRDGRILVPVRKLAALAGQATPGKGPMPLPVCERIVSAAGAAGFEALPNPRLLLRPWKGGERVALVRLPEQPCAEGEPWYLAGALLLALGAAMAEADGEVDHIEVLHVSEIVNSLYHFNDFDKHRLGVLRKRLLKYPPKLASLTRRVRAILSEDELAEVGKFLVGVAGANFRIRDEERLALRRAYRAFRIPVTALDALLEKLEGDPGPDGARAVREEVLAGLMRETRDFAARLGIAMQALEKTGAKDNARGIWYARKPPAAPEITRDAEPDPYRDALYALLRRPDWTEADFIALGEQHGVFVAGAVRGVDAWASEFSGGDSVRLALSPDEDWD
ncbi:MAG: TerB N-terminal domain-containing protein [Candidatus Hydrogenedentes bacterium]|nr:TerB N-terminal domain-containing protein [Candidatus Hydrogenedentota bacterium]